MSRNLSRTLTDLRATIDERMIIHAPAHVLYRFWRDVENLPTIWRQLDDVQALDPWRSFWVATSPVRDSVTWQIEIFDEGDDASIAWHSTGGDLSVTGRVSFNALTPLRTAMQVTIGFAGPAGELDVPTELLGEGFAGRMANDLRSFKRAMETGGLLPVADPA